MVGNNTGAMGAGRAAGALLLTSLLTGATVAAAATATPLGTPAQVPDGIILTAIGEVLYDSNVLRTGSAALLGGGHRDDIRYSPAASVTYNRSAGRLSVTANGLAGHDFFQYNSYLDRNHFTGDGLVTYRAGGGCQATASGSYSSRQGGIRGSSLAAIDPAGNPDDIGRVIDNVQDAALYGINANCGSPSGRLSFGAGYNHSSLRNAAAVRKFGDSDSDTYSGNVGVGILRPGLLSLNGSYSTIGYPNRMSAISGVIVPLQFQTTGVHSYRVGLSLTRPIGTRLNGTIGVSYLHAEPTGGQSPYSSPAYNLALAYVSSPRLSFAVTGSRDIVASSTAGALYRVVDQALLSSQYSLGEAITLSANAGLIRNNFQQAFAIVGEPLRRNELSKTAGLAVTYAPRSLYDVTLGVIETIRTADPNVYNYNSTKVSLRLAVHI